MLCIFSLVAQDFIQHNQKFLSRVYPGGARMSSSNYNPQEFWNVGSQLGESRIKYTAVQNRNLLT